MNSRHRSDDTTPDTSSADRARPGMILAASFLCLVLVAGALTFAFTRHDHHGESRGLTTPAPRPSVTTTVTPGTVPGLGVPEADIFGRRVDIPIDPAGVILAQRPQLQNKPTDPDWLTAAPAGLCDHRSGRRDCAPGGWQKIHGAVVPMSISDGPTRLEHGVAAGYAHTPQGAALAAAYTVYELAARPGDTGLRKQRVVLTDADRKQFDAAAAQGRLPAQLGEIYTRWLLAVDAFRVDSYTEDYAVISLAARGAPDRDQQSWSAVAVPMVWHDGDWRVRGTGSQLPTRTVRALAGWTTW